MMEKMEVMNKKEEMMKELIEGIEATKKLRDQIMMNPRTTHDDHDHSLLVEKMLSSFDKTISIANLMMGMQLQIPSSVLETQPQTPLSCVSTPSLGLNSPPNRKSHLSKKRKRMSQETKRIRVEGPVSGLEGPLDDGFSWRKYGQKAILGANFPRGYYRCTHRHSQGCGATKQVQLSDADPTIYEVVYSGSHTCFKGDYVDKAQPKSKSTSAQIKSEAQIQQTSEQEIFVGLSPDGEIKVEQLLDCEKKAQFFRTFSFSSAFDNANMLGYAYEPYPCFVSPTTSESNYFPASIIGSNENLNVQLSDSDHNEAMSTPNSVTNSPIIGDFEFPIDQLLDLGEPPY